MKEVFDMNGVERAAALMVALGPRVAAEIMKHLDEASIEKITTEVAKIDRLGPQEREELIGQFLIDLRREKRRLRGGEGTARDVARAVPPTSPARSAACRRRRRHGPGGMRPGPWSLAEFPPTGRRRAP